MFTTWQLYLLIFKNCEKIVDPLPCVLGINYFVDVAKLDEVIPRANRADLVTPTLKRLFTHEVEVGAVNSAALLDVVEVAGDRREILYQPRQIVAAMRPVRMPGDLDLLPRLQLLIGLPQQALRLVLQFGNLIGNALRYIPPGSDIEISLQPTKEGIALSVSDNVVTVTDETGATATCVTDLCPDTGADE